MSSSERTEKQPLEEHLFHYMAESHPTESFPLPACPEPPALDFRLQGLCASHPIHAVAAASTRTGLSFVTVLCSTSLGMRHFGLQRKGALWSFQRLTQSWPFPLCANKHNTGLSLVCRGLPSQPGHTDKPGFILTGWTKGTSTDRAIAAAHWHPQSPPSPQEKGRQPCMILMCNSLPSNIMSLLFHEWRVILVYVTHEYKYTT